VTLRQQHVIRSCLASLCVGAEVIGRNVNLLSNINHDGMRSGSDVFRAKAEVSQRAELQGETEAVVRRRRLRDLSLISGREREVRDEVLVRHIDGKTTEAGTLRVADEAGHRAARSLFVVGRRVEQLRQRCVPLGPRRHLAVAAALLLLGCQLLAPLLRLRVDGALPLLERLLLLFHALAPLGIAGLVERHGATV